MEPLGAEIETISRSRENQWEDTHWAADATVSSSGYAGFSSAMAKPPTKHVPRGRDYAEPLRSKLPALEQNVLKLRAMNMILVLFYAEELKWKVEHGILVPKRKAPNGPPPSSKPRKKPNPVGEALKALVADGALTANEKKEIVTLIDFRNFIAHQVQHLLSDVGGQWAHQHGDERPKGVPEFNRSAVTRFRHFRKRLNGLARTHHYVFKMSITHHLPFEAAEKTYLLEIKRLRRKIARLLAIREAQINKVNAELHVAAAGLSDVLGHPAMRHQTETGEGRLTKVGEETVYKLFDLGKSPMAVAHLTRLSLDAVRKRQKMWRARTGARPGDV